MYIILLIPVLMLNFIFRSHKGIRRIGYIVFSSYLAILGSNLEASEWEFDKDLYQELKDLGVTDEQIQSWYDQYSVEDIENPQILADLYSQLLEYLSLSSVEVMLSSSGKRVVFARTVKKIYSINVHIELSELKKHLDRELKFFYGSEYTSSSVERIEKTIERQLIYRGYYKHSLSSSVNIVKSSVSVDVDITIDYPCTISSIEKPDLPFGIYFNIYEQDICDGLLASEELNRIRVKLKDRQYYDETLGEPKFDYNPETNTAVLKILGSIGKRVGVDVKVKGATYALTDLFREDPTDIDLSSIDIASVKDELKTGYRSYGYEDVVVSEPTEKETESETEYKFDVKLNTRYIFAGFEIHGNNFFSSEKIEEISDMRSMFDSYFNYSKLKEGIEYIKTEYRKNGFWNIKISDPKIVKDTSLSTIRVILYIEEGAQRVFSGLSITGSTIFTKDYIWSLWKTKLYDGIDYSQIKLLERSIKEAYISKGYLYADIKLKINYTQNEDDNKIETDFSLTIKENDQMYVGRIKITGNNKVRTKAIERELRFKTFDVFDPEMIDLSRRIIMSLGLFTKVNFNYGNPYTLKGKPVVDISIDVVEGSAGNVSFGPGWSLYKGFRFSVEGAYNNLTGLARKVFSRVQISEEWKQTAIDSSTILGRTLSVGYVEPYLKNLPISTTVSYTDRTTADETRLYTKTFDLTLYHKFRRTFSNSGIGLVFKNKRSREEGSLDQQDAYLKYIGGNYRIGSVGIILNWDRRSDVSWPIYGGNLSTEFSVAKEPFGGDVEYKHYKFMYSHYFDLPSSWVFALSWSFFKYWDIHRGGSVVVENFLPVSQATHLGGADSVRGFKERSLGPYVKYNDSEGIGQSVNLGGSSGSVFKFELRYRFESLDLISALFMDFGNVSFSKGEIDSFNEKVNGESQIVDNVYYDFYDVFSHPEYIWTKNYKSVGLSLGYLTPLGSISLSYGIPLSVNIPKYAENIDRADRDSHFLLRGKVHFSIGSSF